MNKELLKGTIDIMILKMLKNEPMYGYGMINKFSIISKGTFQFKEGTLYPMLHALEKKGYIGSSWRNMSGERKRKYYQITKKGLVQLSEKEVEWKIFSETVKEILNIEDKRITEYID